VASFSGTVENDVIPSNANFSILRYGYFVSPATRSSRSYSTPVWRKPIQLTSPRTKRSFSRSWFS